MFILDTKIKNHKKKILKTSLIYLVLSLSAIIINYVYGLFGHGVHSSYMTWMFLYPLLGGAILYLLIFLLVPDIARIVEYRMFYNIYNSGIATLTIGSLLKGIFDIAGTSSVYIAVFYAIGELFVAVGLVMLLILAVNLKKSQA
ncbi:hypothetical protein GH810_08695 [Acetobacterium paludosum]|uniref:Uncharacterized protein n=1 Tax=Acetobacterium paludosum TaxID=52693 RepID=A0A923HYL0_9FIRM|nr:hypothetical protein [Acetobacterium paludosum]MBC3888386.1 hypothetical protein [Acetobacterium paludosum]